MHILFNEQKQNDYESSPEYQKALIDALAQKQADQIIRSQNPQVQEQPIPFGQKPPQAITGANSL